MRKDGLIRPIVSVRIAHGQEEEEVHLTHHLIIEEGKLRKSKNLGCSVDDCGPGGRTALRATAWYDFLKENPLTRSNFKGWL